MLPLKKALKTRFIEPSTNGKPSSKAMANPPKLVGAYLLNP
jgi:hypothetical protein